jgi:hypothetical protein
MLKMKKFKYQLFKSLYFNFARKGIPAKNQIFTKFTEEYPSEEKIYKKQQKQLEAELEVKN